MTRGPVPCTEEEMRALTMPVLDALFLVSDTQRNRLLWFLREECGSAGVQIFRQYIRQIDTCGGGCGRDVRPGEVACSEACHEVYDRLVAGRPL